MTTGLDVFDKSLQKTNEIFSDIELELGWQERRHQTYQAVRIVLHALRDIFTEDVSAHFSAQLPILLKGIYFDAWNPDLSPERLNAEQFVQKIAKDLRFDTEGGPIRIIQVVFNKITDHMNPNEKEKILSILPKDIAQLLC